MCIFGKHFAFDMYVYYVFSPVNPLQSIYLPIFMFYRIVAKVAKLSNRKLLGVCLLAILIGSVLFGDWQSIGDDPCNSFIIKEAIGECGEIYSGASNETAVNDEYVTNTSVLVEGCQALSTSGNDCFWNRQSRVTGEYCYECLPTCLSSQKSHNIYQLGLAALLLSAPAPVTYVSTAAICSDITSLKSQVRILTQVSLYHNINLIFH